MDWTVGGRILTRLMYMGKCLSAAAEVKIHSDTRTPPAPGCNHDLIKDLIVSVCLS